jgi:hypothetical protein
MITPYKKDIESRIIDNIRIAQASIYIAVAWFTNKRILDVLIEQITSHPQLSFQIVVDDNKTNQIYFFNRATEMSQAGIIIKKISTSVFCMTNLSSSIKNV